MTVSGAWNYVNHIRNKQKKAYAIAYLQAKLRGDTEPSMAAEKERGSLGPMGCQAVWLTLNELKLNN